MIRGKGVGASPEAKRRRVNLPRPLEVTTDEYEEVPEETEEDLAKVRDLKAQQMEVKVEQPMPGPRPIFEKLGEVTQDDYEKLREMLESPTEPPSQGGGTPDPNSEPEVDDKDLGIQLQIHSYLQELFFSVSKNVKLNQPARGFKLLLWFIH